MSELSSTEHVPITAHPSTLGQMYNTWFVDYASYVILERAIPHINDGLKPVQRRILHSLKELDDGRYNKAANVIGNTMKYHPHGDQAIGDALVQIGQKDLLLDTQGNWGNPESGDRAAAPRYIEVRLNQFSKDILFNDSLTSFQASYDGRSKEPITLPSKFPLLLVQGVEGIAVGLSCKVLPHNFNEVIDASIDYLNGKTTKLLPDFSTGGLVDTKDYNDGARGGKVRIRAKIKQQSKTELVIEEIPFGTTTKSLIASILLANEKGKIKISQVEDCTADKVSIIINVPYGTNIENLIEALYIFTECEVTISTIACVIKDGKPFFTNITELLQYSVDKTKLLLEKELRLKLDGIDAQLHRANIEKIFIEEKIYNLIVSATNRELIDSIVKVGFESINPLLAEKLTSEDIEYLITLPIKRISAFDSKKATDRMLELNNLRTGIMTDLADMVKYTVHWYKNLKKIYGKDFQRKTELTKFENVIATEVVMTNETLYLNAETGFAGMALKKETAISKCSNLDYVMVIDNKGMLSVTKVKDKWFVGEKPLCVQIFNKVAQEDTEYTIVYEDGLTKKTFVKKFKIGGITRDKLYNLGSNHPDTRILFFSTKSKGKLIITLEKQGKMRKTNLEYDLETLSTKNRGAQGNCLTNYTVLSISQQE